MFIETHLLAKLLFQTIVLVITYTILKFYAYKKYLVNSTSFSSVKAAFNLVFVVLLLSTISKYFTLADIVTQNVQNLPFPYYQFTSPLTSLFFYSIVFLLCYLFITRYLQYNFKYIFYTPQKRSDTLRWLLYVLFVLIPLSFIASKLALIGLIKSNFRMYIMEKPQVIFIVTLLFASIAEELLFRGIVYEEVKRKTGLLFATITSSIIFTVVHYNQQMAFILVLFVSGIIYCICYERGKSLLVPIALHFLTNLINYILLTEQGLYFAMFFNRLRDIILMLFAAVSFLIIFYFASKKQVRYKRV